jgi:hypothetical protein
VILKGGVLFFYDKKDVKDRDFKFALYKCTLEEFEPEKQENCFLVTNSAETVILKAASIEEMHQV